MGKIIRKCETRITRSKVVYTELSSEDESIHEDRVSEDEVDSEAEINSQVSDELSIDDFEDSDELDTTMESSEEFYGKDGFVWRVQEPNPHLISHPNFSSRHSNLLEPVKGFKKIEEFFNYFIDDTILNYIIDCTNKRVEEDFTLDEIR